MTTVAILGTGRMGGAMARSLARAGTPLVLANRSPDKAQALLDWGAMVQDRLPLAELSHRFWVSGAAHAPCLSVATAEMIHKALTTLGYMTTIEHRHTSRI